MSLDEKVKKQIVLAAIHLPCIVIGAIIVFIGFKNDNTVLYGAGLAFTLSAELIIVLIKTYPRSKAEFYILLISSVFFITATICLFAEIFLFGYIGLGIALVLMFAEMIMYTKNTKKKEKLPPS